MEMCTAKFVSTLHKPKKYIKCNLEAPFTKALTKRLGRKQTVSHYLPLKNFMDMTNVHVQTMDLQMRTQILERRQLHIGHEDGERVAGIKLQWY